MDSEMDDGASEEDMSLDEGDWIAEEEEWPSIPEAVVSEVHPRDCLECLAGNGFDLYWQVLQRAGFRALLNVAATSRMHRNIRMTNLPHFHEALRANDASYVARRLFYRFRVKLFQRLAKSLQHREDKFRTGALELFDRSDMELAVLKDVRRRQCRANFDWLDFFSLDLPGVSEEAARTMDYHESRIRMLGSVSKALRQRMP